MLTGTTRSLSAAALALAGTAVLAPSAQAAKPPTGWRLNAQFTNPGISLFDVAASDTRSAWVVGTLCGQPCYSLTPASYRWNGRSWTPAGITAEQVDTLRTVSTSGPANAWAFGFKTYGVGRLTRSLHWDGNAWTAADLPNGGGKIGYGPVIYSSVTFGAKDTWALGGFDTGSKAPYIAHFDGKKWQQIAAPKKLQAGKVRSAVALSRKDIWALVTEDGTEVPRLLHYDGKSWTIAKTPANFISRGGLAVRSKKDIWLAGARPAGNKSQAGAMHFNGKKWSFLPVPTSNSALGGVTDDGQGGLWAVTVTPQSELWHHVKGHWSKVTPKKIDNSKFYRLFHIPGGSTTLGIGTVNSGPAIFVTGPF